MISLDRIRQISQENNKERICNLLENDIDAEILRTAEKGLFSFVRFSDIKYPEMDFEVLKKYEAVGFNVSLIDFKTEHDPFEYMISWK